jgi:UDP-N-acetylmuramyl pentapeptide phosphotransferase/UDP-N-acetylglucosamine-1-phosphate transferase
LSIVNYQLSIAVLAAITSWLIVWGVRWYSLRGRLIDVPNERSSHTRPTPRGGGLGIVVVVLGGATLLAFQQPTLWSYIVAGGLIAAVSWRDDVTSLSNRVRFGTHLLGAVIVVVAGGWMEQIRLPLIGIVSLGWTGFPLTLFWLVGMTNIYNFMDGIDGIAGTQAVVAGAGWCFLGVLVNNEVVAWLGLVVAGGSVGFLIHNWAPAKIFMGDVGSAFLGFTFGWLGVIATRTDAGLAIPMVLVVWVFLFDTGLTLIRRLQRRENIFTAHRTHLYQRLVIAGQPHAKVTLLYGGLALLGIGTAWLAWREYSDIALGITLLLAIGLWWLTKRITMP